eukprot:CAMPEP_0177650602 /NCGR_PEP_ID=MMETSP0447-20121125/12035_1 /TAXON_ID=0 /ORGANISM="Stygamoeba regulata, Strain BSH-02190019" /LENGTH=76 /DNA_ID=CAMNT_0019153493 /DNA_START=295 /DNA_END=526 /DNA_ORIENTATION=+
MASPVVQELPSPVMEMDIGDAPAQDVTMQFHTKARTNHRDSGGSGRTAFLCAAGRLTAGRSSAVEGRLGGGGSVFD